MNLTEFFHSIVSFFQANLLIALAVTLLLTYMLIRKTKLFFLLFFLAILLAGVLYMISSVSQTGVSQKRRMIETPEETPKEMLRKPLIY
jgi:uncharacterized membrane protein